MADIFAPMARVEIIKRRLHIWITRTLADMIRERVCRRLRFPSRRSRRWCIPETDKAVDVALGVKPEGIKDILGLWVETSEGAESWLGVMNRAEKPGRRRHSRRRRRPKGFPDAINAVLPQSIVQTCRYRAFSLEWVMH